MPQTKLSLTSQISLASSCFAESSVGRERILDPIDYVSHFVSASPLLTPEAERELALQLYSFRMARFDKLACLPLALQLAINNEGARPKADRKAVINLLVQRLELSKQALQDYQKGHISADTYLLELQKNQQLLADLPVGPILANVGGPSRYRIVGFFSFEEMEKLVADCIKSPSETYTNKLGVAFDLFVQIWEKEILAVEQRARYMEMRDQFITANVRLVKSIALMYPNQTLTVVDRIAYGFQGLIKAVDRFQPEKGLKFSTFGSWWIKAAVRRANRAHSGIIAVPVRLFDKKEQKRQDNSAKSKMLEFRRAQSCTSLEAEVSPGSDQTQGSIVADTKILDPSEHVLKKEAIAKMLLLCRCRLTKKEQLILNMRFGLCGYKESTLLEIGRVLKVCRERVRQLERRALLKLRRTLNPEEQNMGD